MNKTELLKAIDKLQNEYDAFYFANKYGKCATHKKEFDLLSKELNLSLEKGILCWVMYEYDCYYKDEIAAYEDNPFNQMRKMVEKL